MKTVTGSGPRNSATRRWWVKVWLEMLHDGKVGALDDRLWRRWVECLLLAGEYENTRHCLDMSGALPPLDTMAWSLHVDRDSLWTELNRLVEAGLLRREENGNLFVVKFCERQKPSAAAERMAAHRQRNGRPSLVPAPDDAPLSAPDLNAPQLSPDMARLYQMFELNFELLTPIMAEEIKDAYKDFGADWVEEAMKETIQSGVKNWKYTRAILERWKKEGYKSQRAAGGNGNGHGGRNGTTNKGTLASRSSEGGANTPAPASVKYGPDLRKPI